MKYIICDDNLEFAELLGKKISQYSEGVSVKIYGSISELMFKLEDEGESCSALFMDIQNKDGNGIEAAIKISEKFPNIKIIYVTGYGSEFSQSIFLGPVAATPVAFLTKPIQEEFLRNALDKIAENKDADGNKLIVKTESGTEFLAFSDIIAISSEGRKLTITTKQKNFSIYGTLKEFVPQLPCCFAQCHRCHIINIHHIEKLQGWSTILMKNGAIYPVGRSHKENVKRIITENY